MANFTPQEIEEMLQEFFDVVGKRQYVGARYVPIFGRKGEDTIEWDNLAPYEPLTVVMHQGVSYVSKQYVPKGIEITDTVYWAETYRFNAQVEQYRQEVLSFDQRITDNSTAISDEATERQEADEQILRDVADEYVPFPDPAHFPKLGILGQVLSTLADGTTKWADPVVPSDAQAEAVITEWLNEHPEATTTVQDGAITDAKLSSDSSVLRKFDGSGITDLNTVTNVGYTTLPFSATIANCPVAGNSYRLLVIYKIGMAFFIQMVFDSTFTKKWYFRLTANGGTNWLNWGSYAVTDSELSGDSSVLKHFDGGSITDLNAVTNVGYTTLPFGSTITNCPVAGNSYRLLVMYRITAGFLVQMLFDGTFSKKWYFRLTTDGGTNWLNWGTYAVADGELSSDSSVLRHFDGNGITDLNTVTNIGYTMLPFSATIEHCPVAGSSFRLLVVYRISAAYLVQMVFDSTFTKKWYFRLTTDGGTNWLNWGTYDPDLTPKPFITPIIENPSAITEPTYTATDITLKIMTYNVAQWTNDSATHIPADKLNNVKQMLCDANPDVIGLQECPMTIDGDSKPTREYVFSPIWKVEANNTPSGAKIYVRQNIGISDFYELSFTSGRTYTHCLLAVGNKTIALYNVHPKPGYSPEDVQIRYQDWAEIAELVANDTHDYVIVTGDFNCYDTDISQFETTFAGLNFTNGGYLGWFDTALAGANHEPCDNIITTPNINVETAKCYDHWYSSLYSDHVPVVCEVRLMQ